MLILLNQLCSRIHLEWISQHWCVLWHQFLWRRRALASLFSSTRLKCKCISIGFCFLSKNTGFFCIFFFLNIISIYLSFLDFIDDSDSSQGVVVAQADSAWVGKSFASKAEKLYATLICFIFFPTKKQLRMLSGHLWRWVYQR